jgi:hypothetical protein
MSIPEKLSAIGRQPRDKRPIPSEATKDTCVRDGRGSKRTNKRKATKFHRAEAKLAARGSIDLGEPAITSRPRTRANIYRGWSS